MPSGIIKGLEDKRLTNGKKPQLLTMFSDLCIHISSPLAATGALCIACRTNLLSLCNALSRLSCLLYKTNLKI